MFIAVFFIAFEFLSFRRTNFLISISSALIILVFYFFTRRTVKKIGTFVSFTLIGALIFTIFSGIIETKFFDIYIDRLNFIFSPHKATVSYETDQGHFEHLAYLFQQTDKLGFWGTGLNDYKYSADNVIATEEGIHNPFIGIWCEYGFFALIYLIAISLIMFYQLVITIIRRNMYSEDFFLLRFSLVLFFVLFIIGTFFFGFQFYTLVKHAFIRTLIFAFLFKAKPEDITYLFRTNNMINIRK